MAEQQQTKEQAKSLTKQALGLGATAGNLLSQAMPAARDLTVSVTATLTKGFLSILDVIEEGIAEGTEQHNATDEE